MTVHTAVVLQGGGALGAYEFGVLKALFEARPGFRPAAVTGISIGAVTAAVLAGNPDPIGALDRLWRRHLVTLPGTETLGNPGMYRIDPWPPFTSIYSTAPLRRTLSQLVDPARLNNGGIRVAVGATNIETGLMRYFDTAHEEVTFEHVAASGALPPGFPAVTIDNNHYWDGGLFSNLPLSPAINALEQTGTEHDVRELIVVELFPMHAQNPTTLPAVLQRMVELQYTSRLHIDKGFADTIGGVIDVLTQVDRQLPADAPVRHDPTYQKLLAHRRIDQVTVITADLPDRYGKANDFSRTSIEARITAGHTDGTAAFANERTPQWS